MCGDENNFYIVIDSRYGDVGSPQWKNFGVTIPADATASGGLGSYKGFERGVQMKIEMIYDKDNKRLRIRATRKFYCYPYPFFLTYGTHAPNYSEKKFPDYIRYTQTVTLGPGSPNYPVRQHQWYHVAVRWKEI